MKPQATVEWECCARGCLCVRLLTAAPAVQCCFSRDDSVLSVCIVFGYVTKPSVSPRHVYFVMDWRDTDNFLHPGHNFLYYILFSLSSNYLCLGIRKKQQLDISA